jgi:hypothetical protein
MRNPLIHLLDCPGGLVLAAIAAAYQTAAGAAVAKRLKVQFIEGSEVKGLEVQDMVSCGVWSLNFF